MLTLGVCNIGLLSYLRSKDNNDEIYSRLSKSKMRLSLSQV